MKKLPEILFFSVKEEAYREAEFLSSIGYAVNITNSGNLIALESYLIEKETKSCSQTSRS